MTSAAQDTVLWREPRSASVWRVAGRAGMGLVWLYVARVVPWTPVAWVLIAFACVAFAHALLAIANLARHRGVVLRVRQDGLIEWSRSLQEVVLRRPLDAVDGPRIEVVLEADHPGVSRADPRVTLKGATRSIRYLPLHGTRVEVFIERANEVAAPYGIEFVRSGVHDMLAEGDDGPPSDLDGAPADEHGEQ